MKLVAMAAVARTNRVIGKDGHLPWYIRPDLIRLSRMLKGKVVIQGRVTYEGMLKAYQRRDEKAKALEKRTNIVISSNKDYYLKKEHGFTALTPEQAIKKAKLITGDDEEVFVIGGAIVFRQMLPSIERLYLTLVENDEYYKGKDYEGDAFFPDYSEFTKVISRSYCKNSDHRWQYVTLEK